MAEELAVGPEALAAEVSLGDDLAADSLDVLGLVLAVEETFDVVLPARRLAALRTYGELEALVLELVAGDDGAGVLARVRVDSASPVRHGELRRLVVLTPYAIEEVIADASRPHVTGVDVRLPAHASETLVDAVRARMVRLAARGVRVDVVRDARWR